MLRHRLRRPAALGFVALLTLAALLPACSDGPVGKDGWLRGDTQAKLDTVAKHLRGTDLAMIEIDHRYHELWWAGVDENWEYAEYQLEKIEYALRNALERRPKRAESAKVFLSTMPAFRQPVLNRDAEVFRGIYSQMTALCNACHELEVLGHMWVEPPTERMSSIHRKPVAPPAESEQ
ncbi:MAG: hypothetical protein H8E31_03085 [Planctomycetes bacterium]|nr:hypothetical protein [Planctomycetota bacterium]